MDVVIHADASPTIGSGHVVRCLALAAALRAGGARVTLAAAHILDGLRDRADALGVPVVPRETAPRSPDWVVIDGYHLDVAARRHLADPGAPRLVLDDVGGEANDATIALNQNLFASPSGPTRAASGELLAGPHYALLGPEFAGASPARPQPSRADRILVTMGGSDPRDATSRAVAALAGLVPRPTVRVVVGTAHPDRAAVARAAADGGFEIEVNVPSLAPHLAWSDLVVSGCGTSVLEAARLGRPIVGVVLADNQQAVARALERDGLGIVVGRHPTLDLAVLRSAVAELRDDQLRRMTIAKVGPSLIDGRGAHRVVRILATGPLALRAATRDDGDALLAWRNDASARAASFDTQPIAASAHHAWLADRIHSESHRIWIGLLRGVAVGVVRFAIDAETATISVVVAPEHRGGGIGTRLIAAGCARLAAELGARSVEAWIRPGNDASEAAFRAAGFRVKPVADSDRICYRLSLEPMR